jgi:hypothetical protein
MIKFFRNLDTDFWVPFVGGVCVGIIVASL